MRVLRLGNSQDFFGNVSSGCRARDVAERLFSEATGEPVETLVKAIWPSPQLPERIEGWVRETEPDLVLLCISSYWVEAEPVAKRFGGMRWLGPAIRQAGALADGRSRLGLGRAVQAARWAAMRTVGGSPSFTPDELTPIIEECVRRVVRTEGVAFALAGTTLAPDSRAGARHRRRGEARRRELFQRLSVCCERLHVPYELPPHGQFAYAKKVRQSDFVHANEVGHAIIGEVDARAMIRAWHQAARDLHTPPASSL